MASALQSQLENWRLRVQTSQAGQFWRWWVAELSSLLPESWQERMQHAHRRVLLRLGESGLELFWQEGAEVQELEVFSLDQDVPVQRQQISDLLTDRELDESPRELVLPENTVLRKEPDDESETPYACEFDAGLAEVY